MDSDQFTLKSGVNVVDDVSSEDDNVVARNKADEVLKKQLLQEADKADKLRNDLATKDNEIEALKKSLIEANSKLSVNESVKNSARKENDESFTQISVADI